MQLTAAREHITSFDRQLREMAEDLDAQRVELAERDKEVKSWKSRAEKAEHKMREQPSRRVVRRAPGASSAPLLPRQ